MVNIENYLIYHLWIRNLEQATAILKFENQMIKCNWSAIAIGGFRFQSIWKDFAWKTIKKSEIQL